MEKLHFPTQEIFIRCLYRKWKLLVHFQQSDTASYEVESYLYLVSEVQTPDSNDKGSKETIGRNDW